MSAHLEAAERDGRVARASVLLVGAGGLGSPLGLYLAGYSSHDVWTLGQAQLMTVQSHARLIRVTP